MILRSELVWQAICEGVRVRLEKQVVRVQGAQPLSIVRKRLPDAESRVSGAHFGTPIVLLHGFGQNRYAWHLSGRSFANYLAARGFDVFNLELRGHGRSRSFGAHRTSSVDEYVREDLPAAFEEVLNLTGAPGASMVGHSLGALVGSAAAASLGGRMRALAMIGAPYRFARGSALLSGASRAVHALANRGLLPRGAENIPVRGIGRVLHAQRAFWNSAVLPIPVRAWAPGQFEPRLLTEYLSRSFDAASMGTLLHVMNIALTGEFRARDGSTDYHASFESLESLPLLVVAGERDLLARPAAVRPAFIRSRSRDKTYRVFDLGHGDLLLGRDAVSTVWPAVGDWLEQRASATAGTDPCIAESSLSK